MSTLPPEDPNGGTPPPPPPSGGYGNYGETSGGAYGAPPPPPPAGPGDAPWSLGAALSYGWTKFQAYVGPSIILALLVLVVGLVFGGIGYVIRSGITTSPHFDSSGNFHDGSGFFIGMIGSAITEALSFLAQTAVGAVVVRAALDVTAGQAPNVSEAINRVPWGKVIVLALIQTVIVFIGFVLCILPGIILSFLFFFSTYFVIDKGVEPVQALKDSVSLVTNNLGSALLWAIVGTIVTIAGICACGVGFLVTFPLVTFGTAYTFKKLTGQPVAA